MKAIITCHVVGVDVSKGWLDVYIHPAGRSMQVDNSVLGIEKLLSEFSHFNIQQVVFEASGGYESLLLGQAEKAGYKTWRVDPKRIKAFRESTGIRAKTDKLDAKIIAMFAISNQPAYEPHSTSHEELKLQSLVRRGNDLKYILIMEKLRMDNPQQHCKESLKDHIAYLEQQIKNIDKEVDNEIDSNKQWREKRDLLLSVPGIGKKVAASLIADVPELGTIENKAAAALIGVAPFNQESGKRRGNAYATGGRMGPRNTLYMAILSACRFNPTIKAFYQKLIAAGKKPKVAIVACMNKMVRILNAILRNRCSWNCGNA